MVFSVFYLLTGNNNQLLYCEECDYINSVIGILSLRRVGNLI